MSENISPDFFKYIEWPISKFIDRLMRKEELLSPKFRFNNDEWFLRIGSNLLINDKPRISLHKVNLEKEHNVKFKIGIQKSDGSNNILIEQSTILDSYNFDEDFESYFPMLDRSTDILSPEGTLTIFFFISHRYGPLLDNESRSPSPEAEIPDAKRQKMNSSIRDGDITLNVKDKEFRANRSILLRRSVFFKRTLQNSATRNISIPFGDSESFDQFLEFLYDNDINIVTSNNMIGLFKNAHECEVPELKNECIRYMKEKLSICKFSDIYDLSYFYNATDLMNSATEFFMNNARKIVITTKWQEYLEERSDVGNELFLKFLSLNNIG